MAPAGAPDQATLEWLLAEDNPSVRYFTLRDLLDRPSDDPEVVRARQLIMQTGAVRALLAGQHPEGYWGEPERLYVDKYHGTSWRLLLLAEMGADGADSAVRTAAEFLFLHSQERADGGFSMHRSAKAGGGRPTEVIPCLTGNMVWSLLSLGYAADPRVQRAIDWIARFQRFDDGVAQPPTGPVYDRFEICYGTHTCHMGAVKALKALAEIPVSDRSLAVQDTIERGVEYFLAHRIYRRSHDLAQIAKPGWLRLGFPLMYQSDILEILLILTKLGVRDCRMRDALDVLAAKRNPDGRWKLESSLETGRLPAVFEAKGRVSKWITLRALTVFRRLT